MMHGTKIIHLRRPPVISLHDGDVFVPKNVDLDDVDAHWRAFCETRPRAFDGRISHVLGVHRNGHGGATLHTADCAYRFYAVQRDLGDLGVRPLGVKGLTMRGGCLLLGRRSMWVASYPGMWEIAPGGAVSPNADPRDVVLEELEQETGLRSEREPTAVCIVFDEAARTWEIVYRLSIATGAAERANDEYEELNWFAFDSLPQPLTPITSTILSALM